MKEELAKFKEEISESGKNSAKPPQTNETNVTNVTKQETSSAQAKKIKELEALSHEVQSNIDKLKSLYDKQKEELGKQIIQLGQKIDKKADMDKLALLVKDQQKASPSLHQDKQDLISVHLDLEKHREAIKSIEGDIRKMRVHIDDFELRNNQLSREVAIVKDILDSKADKASLELLRYGGGAARDINKPSHEFSDIYSNMKAREAHLQNIEDMFNKVSILEPQHSRTYSHKRELGGGSSYHSARIEYDYPPISKASESLKLSSSTSNDPSKATMLKASVTPTLRKIMLGQKTEETYEYSRGLAHKDPKYSSIIEKKLGGSEHTRTGSYY